MSTLDLVLKHSDRALKARKHAVSAFGRDAAASTSSDLLLSKTSEYSHQSAHEDVTRDDDDYAVADRGDDDARFLDELSQLDLSDVLLSMSAFDEHLFLGQRGYSNLTRVCSCLQGEILRAHHSASNKEVAIKKVEKRLYNERIAVQHGFSHVVSEDVVKEGLILKYLTVSNCPIGDYIAQFIDFFQSDDYYYLVVEYIHSEMNLKQFVARCRHYITLKKLSLAAYHKTIKFLLWQLFVTVMWMHNAMNCCHLDLCSENVMVANAAFLEDGDGNIQIDGNAHLKLVDFGVAELFRVNGAVQQEDTSHMFLCRKQGLNIDNGAYAAPQVFNDELYDARLADNWSLGIILYECLTGEGVESLYAPLDIEPVRKHGYLALFNGTLYHFLKSQHVLSSFNKHSFCLLSKLLHVREKHRLHGVNILNNDFFRAYYQKYQKQIKKKFSTQHRQKVRQSQVMMQFPFYTHS